MLRPIAFYLPQFHPIPENDMWWGKGFTEWTNVSKAKPSFTGHYQPHLPSELGFYDLRLPEVREQQALLAKEHGIYGFCYYHYWFNGRRILERPFQEILESGKPDFPFMLCWANENWTRIWDGSDNEVLLEQKYSAQDDIAHIKSLLPTFNDPRYIKVNGKPVFSVYRSNKIPDVAATIKRWRNEAVKAGLELYLCRIESFGESGSDYLKDGFDAAIRFEPFSSNLKAYKDHLIRKHYNNKLSSWFIKYALSTRERRNKKISGLTNRIDYEDYVNFTKKLKSADYKVYPGITPMWDNTARKKSSAFMFINSSPEIYKEWLSFEVERFKPFGHEENFIFINAWNEWAEGNHLEPCHKWGRKYLEVTRDVFLKSDGTDNYKLLMPNEIK
ncbi:glycoside hydrolase family 99-like domain-containing protein [Pontibacter cellulosilyticus]|uniref:Glycoside hydrolase family 99-like domain-containing protein n=1 Tax=Pontibacter cellulosilyticus TaxID=1720253 RepID=A0A923N6X2_9BACT|nr:glycoside hydrolase family 99-like domain-containing protein [Pontibacter cellulosilyticus]MBC5991610.1 glycoside hydrolase family 99-like domain-containing protein [Pontibacter cellulosilyticus]